MKILFIATQLPPYNGSGNIRGLNYINYMEKRGHKVDVVTIDYPKDCIAYDENLENAFNNNVSIYRVTPGLLYKMFYSKKNSVKNIYITSSKKAGTKARFMKKLKDFVRLTVLIPDSFLMWIRPAYKKAKELMLSEHYDIIFSLHETPSSHIAAYKIKKDFPKVRWIGYWSDPWNGDSLRVNRSRIKTFIEEKLELNIVKSVDKLFFTTEATKQLYIKKYNLNPQKADVIYRGYDISLYDEMLKNNSVPMEIDKNRINIVHTGTIYPDLRDINPLCSALDILRNNNRNVFDRFNIIFIGLFVSPLDKEKLKKFENVKVLDPVSYVEALKYVVHTDLLMLYGNKNSSQVPGKVYEYIGSRAAILTILGDSKDQLKEIMEEIDKGPIIQNEKESILNGLVNIYNMYTNNLIKNKWSESNEKYKWENVVEDIEKKMMF